MVAIKAIERVKTSRDKLKRFKNELAFCQNNDHPNIIEIFDSGAWKQDSADIVFYVMPFYQHTLRDKMNRNLTPEESISIFLQLLSALEFAHGKKVYHRDVKPENILIDGHGNTILADFGIAHFAAEDLVTAVETKATDRLANFQYAAPEQRGRNGNVNGAADIYAAALILNELFTGKVISGSGYAKIGDVNGEWAYLDELIEKMIAQDPAQRLFPVEKVFFQLEVLDTEQKSKAELSKLSSAPEQNSDGFAPLDVPQVIGANYNNGQLIVKLDRPVPPEWGNILTNGQYSHGESYNYEPFRFSLRNGIDIMVPVPASDERVIQDLIRCLKSWFSPVTLQYSATVKARYEAQKRKSAQEKQAQIERAQAELRVKQSLKDMFL